MMQRQIKWLAGRRGRLTRSKKQSGVGSRESGVGSLESGVSMDDELSVHCSLSIVHCPQPWRKIEAWARARSILCLLPLERNERFV